MRGEVRLGASALFLLLCACTPVSNPVPSASYDGRYVGTRESNLLEACGITSYTGRTAADISKGNLTMQLFSPETRITGTVGADGGIRGSGLWKTPHGFANFTLLQGQIAGGELTGLASDSRCRTDLALRKIGRR